MKFGKTRANGCFSRDRRQELFSVDMISLESLLESVADAVSSLVTFAAEAGNNNSVLVGLTKGVKGLHSGFVKKKLKFKILLIKSNHSDLLAVNYLVGQARGTVTKWEELGSPEMSAKVKKLSEDILILFPT